MYLVLRHEGWARRNSSFLLSFAAGTMLTISFTHLIPESLELYAPAVFAAFIGFLAFYVLEQLIVDHTCHEYDCSFHRISVLSTVGLLIHSLLDGVAIAVGFEASFSVGVLMTLAVLLHEVPEGIMITGILLHSNVRRGRIIFYALAVALATPLGALAAFVFLQGLSPRIVGLLLALTAGSFIYLSAANLLPETHKRHHAANSVFFFIGVLIILLVGRVLR